MKKNITTIVYGIILLNSAIFSQTTNPTFETGFRVQKAQFTPFDYSRAVTNAEPNWGVSVYKLENNTKTITPFYFIFKDLKNGYGIEFDYTKIQIERANFENDLIVANKIIRTKNYIPNNERSDYKLNFFFYPSQLNEFFSFGLGIRKIDRIRNASFPNYSLEEKFISHGPQLVMKSKIPITDQLSLNLGLDIYHTQGRRDLNYSANYYTQQSNFSYLETIRGNGKTLDIFQGYEANISLKYNFMEHYNMAFGYNYNYSYFKYENLTDTLYYISSESSNIGYQQSKSSNGKEIIRGFYISASTIF